MHLQSRGNQWESSINIGSRKKRVECNMEIGVVDVALYLGMNKLISIETL